MKRERSYIRSPLFYVGDKFKLMKHISLLFPQKINRFFEPFIGGGSVFMNTEARQYILNDIDKNIISLHKFLILQSNNEDAFMRRIKNIVMKYDLSRSFFENVITQDLKSKWPKTYYAHYNRTGYNNLKKDFNISKARNPLHLYVLLIYGFNRMLRFNRKNEFNIPVGNVDFNKNVVRALSDYFSVVKDKDIVFHSKDFRDFIQEQKYQKGDFVYVDPPYLISSSEYNKLWGEEEEGDLLNILTDLNRKGIKFGLSNVTSYNGKKNKKLITWMKDYNVHNVDSNYINYHNNSKKEICEVLITNY